MSVQKFLFEVVENRILADHVKMLCVKSQEQIRFKAGQYFSFKIKENLNRSYSVASRPGLDVMEFLVEIIEGGQGSSFINALNPGDKFEAIGPLGYFTLEDSGAIGNSDQLIFIATGSGISPIRSMIHELIFSQNTARKIDLFFGLRFNEKAYLFDEFEKIAAGNDNFSFYPVISRPDSNWKGRVGHCQDFVPKKPPASNVRVYICGSKNNVESIASTLIECGYDKKYIFHEKF